MQSFIIEFIHFCNLSFDVWGNHKKSKSVLLPRQQYCSENDKASTGKSF